MTPLEKAIVDCLDFNPPKGIKADVSFNITKFMHKYPQYKDYFR